MRQSKVRYHRTYLKLHSEYEDYAAPIIKKALDDQIKPVIKWVNEDNFEALPAYLDYLLTTVPIREALMEIYEKVGVSGAKFSYNWIGESVERKDLLDFFSPQWLKDMVDYFLLNAGTKIAGITNTTVERIRTVIADAQALNVSRREQAKYIEQTLDDPEFNRARSLVIARTESTTAANYGINLGAQSADYYTEKFWIDTKDSRTRKTHIMAGASPAIPMNGVFTVGGSLMQYPGDPTAPAEEVVSCRCVLGIKVVTDELGLPVLKPTGQRMMA